MEIETSYRAEFCVLSSGWQEKDWTLIATCYVARVVLWKRITFKLSSKETEYVCVHECRRIFIHVAVYCKYTFRTNFFDKGECWIRFGQASVIYIVCKFSSELQNTRITHFESNSNEQLVHICIYGNEYREKSGLIGFWCLESERWCRTYLSKKSFCDKNVFDTIKG